MSAINEFVQIVTTVLSKVQDAEGSDTTTDATSTAAGNRKIFLKK